jgi:hypothetical protein
MPCPEDSQSACPTHGEVVASVKTRPPATCVPIVHIVFPASHVGSATIQILATSSLTEVESILPEETMAIGDARRIIAFARCTDNSPPIASVRTMIPEEHPSMTTTLKHLESHQTPTSAHMWSGLSIAPAVQTIIVDCVAIVNPQLAPIIRDNAEMVVACPEDSQAACPTHSEMIASAKTRPPTSCVAIVYHMSPASQVWSATLQVLTTATLAEVEGIFHKETSSVSDWVAAVAPAFCTHDDPSVASVRTMVSEQHPSITTTLKHLKSYETPSTTNMPSGRSTAPTVQAIIVNGVPIVNPQLAAIIRNKLEVVMACPEDSQAASPSHCEVIPATIARPIAAGITIVHIVFPTGKVGAATVQVLTTTSLAKEESIFHEEARAICNRVVGAVASATCTYNKPTVASIRTMVPEKHTSITTSLEHLKSYESPSTTNMPSGRSAAPAMQAIIVNGVSIVNPQLAPIIGDKLEMVMARLEDSQAACPTHCEVIPAAITRPIAPSVTVVDIVLPASKIRSAAFQILTTTSLAKVERIFHKQTMAICDGIVADATATGTQDRPSVASVGTSVPQQHPSSTTTLKHLKSHKVPSSTLMLGCLTIAPAMQAIIVDCVSIVDPQLAPIIGDNAKPVMSSLEDSHAGRPTHSKVIASVETRPFATSVTIVHRMFPAGHVGFATIQVLASTPLAKVEHVLPEETMAISGGIAGLSSAACAHNSPSVTSVRTMVPEQHASMATTLKHLKSH